MEIEKITKAKLYPEDLREFVEQGLRAQGYEVKGGLSALVFANLKLELELVTPAPPPSKLYKELSPAVDKEEQRREDLRKYQRDMYARRKAQKEAAPPTEQPAARREPGPPKALPIAEREDVRARVVERRVADELSREIAADIKELKEQAPEPEVVAPADRPFPVSELLLTLNQSS